MANPTYTQARNFSQGGGGLNAETLAERVLSLIASLASAQNPDGTPLFPGGGNTATSIPAGTSAITNGTALDNGTVRQTHTAIITATSTPTGGTVALEASHDNTNWYTVGTQTISAAGVTAITGTIAARYVRASVTVAITGGGAVGATVASV